MTSIAEIKGLVSPEEWQLRVELACAYRLAAYYGWDDFLFTHMSVRIPGQENHFLLNPLDLMFDEITASSLVKIDIEGNNVLDTPQVINKAGFVIHSAVHMARDDAHCAIHLHSLAGQAVSAMSCGLLPLTQTGMLIQHDIGYHDYEGPAFNLEERQRLIADFGNKHFMMLRNHGTLTVGETVSLAFMRTYFLIRACEVQVRAMAAGQNGIIQPPAGTLDKAADSNDEMYSFLRDAAWPVYMRKMDKLDPSYRD